MNVDIEALLFHLEETHQRDLQSVCSEVADWVSPGEASIASLETCISQLKEAKASYVTHVTPLQLHLENLEDWSYRNNLRL